MTRMATEAFVMTSGNIENMENMETFTRRLLKEKSKLTFVDV